MLESRALFKWIATLCVLVATTLPVAAADASAEHAIAESLVNASSHRWAWLDYWQNERPGRVLPSKSGVKVVLSVVQDKAGLAFCLDELKYCALYLYGIDGLVFSGEWCNTCPPPAGNDTAQELRARRPQDDLAGEQPPASRRQLRIDVRKFKFSAEVTLPPFSARTYLNGASVSNEGVTVMEGALRTSVSSYLAPHCRGGLIEFARPRKLDTVAYAYVDLGQGCEKGVMVLRRSHLGRWEQDSFNPSKNDIEYFRPLINKAGIIRMRLD